MPKEKPKAKPPNPPAPVGGTIYTLQVKFDAEDHQILEELHQQDKLPRATLLKQYMRAEYRRRKQSK